MNTEHSISPEEHAAISAIARAGLTGFWEAVALDYELTERGNHDA